MTTLHDLVLNISLQRVDEAWAANRSSDDAPANIHNLPDLVLETIFEYCGTADLLQNVRTVCKKWFLLLHESYIWNGKTLNNNRSAQMINDADLQSTLQYTKRLTGLELKWIDGLAEFHFSNQGLADALKYGKCLKKIFLFGHEYLHVAFFKSIVDNCPKLESLILVSNGAIYEGVDDIPAFCFELLKANKNLRELSISNFKVGDVDSTRRLKDETVVSIVNHCCYLEKLTLEQCSELTDASLKAIVDAPLQLKSLALSGDAQYTASGLKEITRLSSLQKLTLSNFHEKQCLSDTVIKAISLHCSQIEFLRLSENTSFSDDAVYHITKNLKSLTHLYLDDTAISDVSIGHISEYCRKLQQLSFENCEKLTAACVSLLICNQSALPVTLLRLFVDYFWWKDLPKETRQALEKCYPYMEVLFP